MKKIIEGNLYNTQDEIWNDQNPSESGIHQANMEVRKELVQKLMMGNITNIHQIISQILGDSLR
jgi:hypothetical protein